MKWQQLWFRVLMWVKYFRKAQGLLLLHSPSLFELYSEIKKARRLSLPSVYLDYLNELKKVRSQITLENTPGAGSHNKETSLSFWEYFKQTKFVEKDLKTLQGVINYHNSKIQILELGTGTGATAQFLSNSSLVEKIQSIDANPVLHQEVNNIVDAKVELTTAYFDEVLDQLLDREQYFLILVDGNHSYDATLRYYRLVCEKSSAEFIVFDDIRWSSGMYKAWREIAKDLKSGYALDFGRMGVIWRKEKCVPQYFYLK